MAESKMRTVAEHKLFDVHARHDQHLCHLVNHRLMNRVAELAKDAKYICHICGRAAAQADHLCEPIEI